MEKRRYFDTSHWSKERTGNPWPPRLVPLKGFISEPSRRPLFLVKVLTEVTSVTFPRIYFDVEDFLRSWIRQIFSEWLPEDEVRDEKSQELLRAFRLIVLMGEDISSREIELEAAFSPRELQKARIPFQNTWEAISDRDVERLWKEVLPAEIRRATIPILNEPFCELEKVLSVRAEMANFFLSTEGKNLAVDTIIKRFRAEVIPPGTDLAPYKQVVFDAWQMAHASLHLSVEQFLSNPLLLGALSRTANGAATIRAARFWYTRNGPWKEFLGGCVPALRGAIPSLYSRLSLAEKDKFDQAVFIGDRAPPREVLIKLLKFVETWADSRGELLRYESRKKRQQREGTLGLSDPLGRRKGALEMVSQMGEIPVPEGMLEEIACDLSWEHLKNIF